MPSTDINGEPILVLSKKEAQEIVSVFENVYRARMSDRILNLGCFKKAKQLLEECDDSNDSAGERVYQQRLWPE